MKFFLHVSKEEQKQRFLARLDKPGKHWKFNAADVAERAHWDDYMQRVRGRADRHVDPVGALVRDPGRPQAGHPGPRRADPRRDGRTLDLRWPEVSEADHAANVEARRKLEAETQ